MPQLSARLILKIVPVVVMGALLLPSVASAQATRTWVSGVGDDANPCSRTAPCKTFAGAISKTAAGGIIMALDDGGFGALTITKPITVDGGRNSAGMLASGGINAVNININPASAPANFVNNGRVVLKNLKMEGNTGIPSAGGFTPGLNGVRITNARNVKIVNSDIGFFSRSGIAVEPDASQSTKVQIVNSYIHDNGGAGIATAPKNGASAVVSARRNEIDDNGCGISAGSFGFAAGFNIADSCALSSGVSGIVGTSSVFASSNSLIDNTHAGALARGGTSVIRMSNNDVTRNGVIGIQALDSGRLETWGNNAIGDNGPGGTVNGTFSSLPIPLARATARP